jgi:hypothetical protein
MSSAAMHPSREIRKLCERCWQRKALFRYRGAVRADVAVQPVGNRTDQSVEAQ